MNRVCICPEALAAYVAGLAASQLLLLVFEDGAIESHSLAARA
jgi:hypothetical protein